MFLVAINCTFSGSTTHFFVITDFGIVCAPSECGAPADIVCTKDGFESYDVPRIMSSTSHSSTSSSNFMLAVALSMYSKLASSGNMFAFKSVSSVILRE